MSKIFLNAYTDYQVVTTQNTPFLNICCQSQENIIEMGIYCE